MSQISDKEFKKLDEWGYKRFGNLWEKLSKRQKKLFSSDPFYKQYRKGLCDAKTGIHK